MGYGTTNSQKQVRKCLFSKKYTLNITLSLFSQHSQLANCKRYRIRSVKDVGLKVKNEDCRAN